MVNISIGGRNRKLRKSSVFILVAIALIIIYRVYVNYFYQNPSACFNNPPQTQNELFLTVSAHGTFDQMMFQYASLLGLAKLNGRRAVFPANTALENIFHLKHISSDNTVCWQKISESIPMAYDEEFIAIPQRNVSISGFLQSWRYSHSIEQTIRQEFRFKDPVSRHAKRLYAKFASSAINKPVMVGVHICRYNTLNINGFVHSNVAPLSYINKAMNHMRTRFESVQFVVVCDDVNWCQAYIKDSDVKIVNETTTPEQQLALLSLCDHNIITVGTVGYWAAWLANGHTVFYNNFINKNSALAKQIRYVDFFPSNWISISS